MKIDKLRELSVDELRARSRELKQEILHLRIQKATGQLENKCAIKNLRKENARIETILSERRLNLQESCKKGRKESRQEGRVKATTRES